MQSPPRQIGTSTPRSVTMNILIHDINNIKFSIDNIKLV